GFFNLAVFFHACSFNCLFCQNWHFKKGTFKPDTVSLSQLISSINRTTSCICYFGGDPIPQMPFVLKASRLAIEENRDKILRICFETNGCMNETLLSEIIQISLNSGGCIKFDLKAWDDNLHRVLTGITNKRTIANFSKISEYIKKREIPPLLIASTLLIPGYIDEEEIRSIAKFIASLNPEIPYSLLAFYPHFYMSDMPLTKKVDAEKFLKVAKEEGLKRVRLGNIHLLR
ncbi:MAG: radical SAM protein, partial [Thermodesulfovibrionales bacterium]|nr:radical SAM protein [Thermodesulfovibrionales bacterium]